MQEKAQKIYAIVLRYPESNTVDLQSISEFVTEKTKVKMLGYDKEIEVSEGGIIIVCNQTLFLKYSHRLPDRGTM